METRTSSSTTFFPLSDLVTTSNKLIFFGSDTCVLESVKCLRDMDEQFLIIFYVVSVHCAVVPVSDVIRVRTGKF